MPVLSNPRHERFAQAIVARLASGDYTQAKAYQDAGYKAQGHAARVNASRLLAYADKIGARVAELQGQVARKKKATVETIVDRLDIASRIAEEDRLPSALAQAEQAKAKILGLSIDRQEHGKPGDFGTAQSINQLAEMELRNANPALDVIEDWRLEGAKALLARHADAMETLAHASETRAQAS